MRARREQHDRAALGLELRSELLDEQQRRADVLVQECVDVLGRQLAEPSVAAARVIDDERVERAERFTRRRDDARRRVRVGEIGFEIGLEVVAAPRERLVVGRPPVRVDARTGASQPLGDREPDPPATRDAGDERVSQVVRTPTTSRTASLLARSASCSSSERSSSTISSIPPAPSLTGTPM
jgi:hypothetical protein